MNRRIMLLYLEATHRIGLYTPFEATSERQREECLALMDLVRRDELNRVVGESALSSAAITEDTVPDRFFAVRHGRSGRVVACNRALRADDIAHLAESRREYGLERIPDELLSRFGVVTRLVAHPDFRRTPAAAILLRHVYEMGMRERFEACLLTSEPGTYRIYRDLGFRPFGRCIQSPKGGWRIPMIMINHDLDHLRRIDSPLLGTLKRIGPRRDLPVEQWFRSSIESEGGIDPGISFVRADDAMRPTPPFRTLHRGLSEDGSRALFRNATRVHCRAGDIVFREGDGGRQLGIVEAGELHILRNGMRVASFGAGDIFGESGLILGEKRDCEARVAADDTKIVLLSQRSIERIAKVEDEAALWRNLAAALARRTQRISDAYVRASEDRREVAE